jgi:hypothetical protein
MRAVIERLPAPAAGGGGATAIVIAALASAACNQILGNNHEKHGPGDGAGMPDAFDPCAARGLPSTTLSGRVFLPDGVTPLADATVYVPSAALTPIADGAGPPTCASGAPVARAKSDASGAFKLVNVPAGINVQVVVQVGKWRRDDVVIASVPQCTDTPLAADQTRLPRTTAEGHIPHIAMKSGAADSIECFAREIGIDAAMIGTPVNGSSSARVDLFVERCSRRRSTRRSLLRPSCMRNSPRTTS